MAKSRGRLFFATECDEAAGRAILSEEEAHHAHRVLRLRVGDEVGVLCDGHRYPGVLENGAVVRLTGTGESQSRPRLSVYVGVGRPKSPAASAIVEAATELGAVEIAFFTSERSVVRTPGGDSRWRRVTYEACKQCGRYSPPRVWEPIDLAAWADRLPTDAVRLRLAEADGCPAIGSGLDSTQAVALLFGPEGGLSPAEESLAAQMGFAPVSLGPLVLRVETAVAAAVARLGPMIWRVE